MVGVNEVTGDLPALLRADPYPAVETETGTQVSPNHRLVKSVSRHLGTWGWVVSVQGAAGGGW